MGVQNNYIIVLRIGAPSERLPNQERKASRSERMRGDDT